MEVGLVVVIAVKCVVDPPHIKTRRDVLSMIIHHPPAVGKGDVRLVQKTADPYIRRIKAAPLYGAIVQ